MHTQACHAHVQNTNGERNGRNREEERTEKNLREGVIEERKMSRRKRENEEKRWEGRKSLQFHCHSDLLLGAGEAYQA
eukprot:1185042-Amorphochlora_amoeboformis.AAC.1